MKNWSAVVALALLALLPYAPDTAQALSCVAPTLNENTIDDAVVIFEGVPGRKRTLRYLERTAIKAAGVATKGGGIADLRVYDFMVTKGWKGVEDGGRVEILRNTHWGDSFSAEVPYLVVAERRIGDLYLTSLCGSTVDLSWAAESGMIETLGRLLGDGQAVR